jgi:hypothetical protein
MHGTTINIKFHVTKEIGLSFAVTVSNVLIISTYSYVQTCIAPTALHIERH